MFILNILPGTHFSGLAVRPTIIEQPYQYPGSGWTNTIADHLAACPNTASALELLRRRAGHYQFEVGIKHLISLAQKRATILAPQNTKNKNNLLLFVGETHQADNPARDEFASQLPHYKAMGFDTIYLEIPHDLDNYNGATSNKAAIVKQLILELKDIHSKYLDPKSRKDFEKNTSLFVERLQEPEDKKGLVAQWQAIEDRAKSLGLVVKYVDIEATEHALLGKLISSGVDIWTNLYSVIAKGTNPSTINSDVTRVLEIAHALQDLNHELMSQREVAIENQIRSSLEGDPNRKGIFYGGVLHCMKAKDTACGNLLDAGVPLIALEHKSQEPLTTVIEVLDHQTQQLHNVDFITMINKIENYIIHCDDAKIQELFKTICNKISGDARFSDNRVERPEMFTELQAPNPPAGIYLCSENTFSGTQNLQSSKYLSHQLTDAIMLAAARKTDLAVPPPLTVITPPPSPA